MASRYAILPRSSIEVVHLPFHRGYRCLCSVTAAQAYVEEWRVLDLFGACFNSATPSCCRMLAEVRNAPTPPSTVIPLARSFERGRKTGVTAPGEAFAPLASVSPAELGSARGHPSPSDRREPGLQISAGIQTR